LAALEAEALLIGSWKSIQDLEDNLTLEELHVVIAASREKEQRHNEFMAALKGINLREGDEKQETAQDRVETMKRRLEARQRGVTEEQMELTDDFGIDIEFE
jgi:hypothetical protein